MPTPHARHVLLVSLDRVGDNMAGPGLRYWHMARVLAQHFPVVLAAPGGYVGTTTPPFPVVDGSRRSVRSQLRGTRAVVVQPLAFGPYPFLKRAGIPLVFDLYGPYFIENLEGRKAETLATQVALHAYDMADLLEHLSVGDYFICATEKQRDFWLGMLAATNRVNPVTYQADPSLRSLIDLVPFGLPDEEPRHEKKVLRGVRPGFGPHDRILLWGGGLWDWLDPLTFIRAVALLSEHRPDVRLFFMGTRRPGHALPDTPMVMKAEALARDLRVKDRCVFFNDWVTWTQRQNYLLEADLGISGHVDHLETRFAFRTRILDYLWTGVPVLCTEGDSLADLVKERGYGLTVPPGDVEAAKSAMVRFLDDPRFRAQCRQNILNDRDDFKWSRVVAPLVAYCRDPHRQPDTRVPRPFARVGTFRRTLRWWLRRGRQLLTRGGWSKAVGYIRRRLTRPT